MNEVHYAHDRIESKLSLTAKILKPSVHKKRGKVKRTL